MRDVFFRGVRSLVASWTEEADRRLQVAASDPVAQAIAYCASELEDRLRDLESRTQLLSVAAYADLHSLTAPTVRRWCDRGEIEAEKRADGDWLIPADAKRRRTARRVARVA